MFGAHIPELILILVGALIVFGPKRLPEIGGALGKGIRDFKKGVADHTEGFEEHTLPDHALPVHGAGAVEEHTSSRV